MTEMFKLVYFPFLQDLIEIYMYKGCTK